MPRKAIAGRLDDAPLRLRTRPQVVEACARGDGASGKSATARKMRAKMRGLVGGRRVQGESRWSRCGPTVTSRSQRGGANILFSAIVSEAAIDPRPAQGACANSHAPTGETHRRESREASSCRPTYAMPAPANR